VNRLSKRLNSLASFVNKNDSIVDVGCDHGYLSIYLVEHHLCQKAICSDVNQKALDSAKTNIKKYNVDIDTYLSDGIKNVPLEEINTIIISGMGTTTIIKILNDTKKLKNIDKIIIQSNNDYELLRKYMNTIGYYMQDEIAIYDKGKWYLSMLFIKSTKTNTEKEIKYGLLNNENYKEYLIDKFKKLLEKVPKETKSYNKYTNILKDIGQN